MKRRTVFAVLTLVAVTLLAANAFAAAITVSEPVTFNGKTLAPGNYKVVYTGTGPEVQVTLLQGKTTVASSPAKLEDRGFKSDTDSIVVQHKDGAAPALTEIRFGGKSKVLVLADSAIASSGMSR